MTIKISEKEAIGIRNVLQSTYPELNVQCISGATILNTDTQVFSSVRIHSLNMNVMLLGACKDSFYNYNFCNIEDNIVAGVIIDSVVTIAYRKYKKRISRY